MKILFKKKLFLSKNVERGWKKDDQLPIRAKQDQDFVKLGQIETNGNTPSQGWTYYIIP